MRRGPYHRPATRTRISIHAPRAGCDAGSRSSTIGAINFNPRTPCGVRPTLSSTSTNPVQFQSTHPVRGATHAPRRARPQQRNFNPRTPCGVRPRLGRSRSTASTNFNPRTPCGVRPFPLVERPGRCSNFNPRTPCGVRLPAPPRLVFERLLISIHAPRAGCDGRKSGRHERGAHFNPRTPCGVRLNSGSVSRNAALFQSTHPVRGATADQNFCGSRGRFQSTHPVRGATVSMQSTRFPAQIFQSTHPVRGATSPLISSNRRRCDFNPRTPCGVRQALDWSGKPRAKFQSTHPVRGATANLTILTR